MHDLRTISRLNAEAFGPAITNLQRQGRFVVAKYAGLHILSIESFSDETEARADFDEAVDSPDKTKKLFAPIASADGANPVQRDQSEDRTCIAPETLTA